MKTILVFSILLAQLAFSQVKYVLPCNSELLEASLDTALAQVGTIERTGRNDGDVEKYLNSVGLGKGYPYCAAGQYYCFYVSAKALKLPITFIPIKRTGLANDMFNDAVNRGVKARFKPAKHDFIVWKSFKSFSGHIERLYQTGKRGWVNTIGFNTISGKSGVSRDGRGVFLKKRNIYHPLGRMKVRGIIGFRRI